MRILLVASLTAMLSSVACTSDAEMRETLKKYEDPPKPACLREDGVARLQLMQSSSRATTHLTGDWTVVRIGAAYNDWTAERTESWIRLYADGDACASGSARKIEFQSPSGRVIGRADPVRGIQIER